MLSKTKNIDNINNARGNENALVNLKPLNDWAQNWDKTVEKDMSNTQWEGSCRCPLFA